MHVFTAHCPVEEWDVPTGPIRWAHSPGTSRHQVVEPDLQDCPKLLQDLESDLQQHPNTQQRLFSQILSP